MNNRKQLLDQIEAVYQEGKRFYAADEYKSALASFIKAKDLLETIPEKEFDDHENRELGRNYHNIAASYERLYDERKGDEITESQLAAQAIPNYQKAASFFERIINKTPEDLDRIRKNTEAYNIQLSGYQKHVEEEFGKRMNALFTRRQAQGADILKEWLGEDTTPSPRP